MIMLYCHIPYALWIGSLTANMSSGYLGYVLELMIWYRGSCYGLKLNWDVVEQSRSKEYTAWKGLRQPLNFSV